MTREQKIDWLRKADTETLLKQYETCVRKMDHIFEIAGSGRETLESISENYDLTRAEVISRMTGGKE